MSEQNNHPSSAGPVPGAPTAGAANPEAPQDPAPLQEQLLALQAVLQDQDARLSRLEMFVGSQYYAGSPAPAPALQTTRVGRGTAAPPGPPPTPGTPGWTQPGRTPAPATVRAGMDLESLIGGNILNRIGAVALILGLGFLSKLASDHGWITPPMRVLFGLLAGMGLLAAGELVRRRGLTGYSYGLSGSGFAALYLSVYSAFFFYHLIGFTLAFVLLAGVSAAGVTAAVLIDAEPVAVLGVLGGFLTPAILSSAQPGTGGAGGFFTYLWILDAGVLGAACFKDWKLLKVGSLVLTQLFFLGWMINDYRPEDFTLVLVASTALFLLFVAVAAASHLMWRKPVDQGDLFLVLENPAAYALLLYGHLYSRTDWQMMLGLYFLLLCALYAALSGAALRRSGWDAALAVGFLAVSAGFLTAAIPLAVHGTGLLAGWAVEAALLLWGGCRAPSSALRSTAYVVYLLVALDLLVRAAAWIGGSSTGSGFLLEVEIPFVMGIASFAAGEHLARQHASRLRADEQLALPMLGSSGYLAGFAWLTLEVVYRTHGGSGLEVAGWLSAAWSVYAAALLAYGIAARRRLPRLCGLGLLGLVILKVFCYDVLNLENVYRVLSLFTLAAVLWIVSYLYTRYRDRVRELVLAGDE